MFEDARVSMPDVLSAVFNSSEEDCDNFSFDDDSDRPFENPAENDDSSGLGYESEIDSFNDTANTSSTSIATDANNSVLEPGLNQSNEQNVSNVVSQSDSGITLAAQERIKVRLVRLGDFFHLYISQEFLEILVDETNWYAEQCRKSHSEDTASGNMILNWAPVDMNEMKTFMDYYC